MALSTYQAPPFRTMDDAQHIPASAQHSTEHTMANVALTQTIVHLRHYKGSRKVPRALHGHGSIQAIKRFYSHTTLFQQGTQATSACIYPNIFSAVRGIHKQFTARSSCITRDRQSIFPHITASHGDLLAPCRCNMLFGQAHTPIFLAPRAEYTTMYNETLAYNQGIESTFPHITAPPGE